MSGASDGRERGGVPEGAGYGSGPNARVVLPGSGSTRAEIEVERRSAGQRAFGALLILAVGVALAPIVFLVPPHLLWPVVAVGLGGLLAWRHWRGHYSVVRFEGRCPRCGTGLELEPGTRIRARHSMECYGCHRQPELRLEASG